MTYSEDLINATQLGNTTYLDEEVTYPSLFGVSLSPAVLGGLIAVTGFGIAGYFGYTALLPQQQTNQELSTKLSQLEQQIQERKENAKKIVEAKAKLDKVKAQKEVVLSLFANEKKLDTLLLDLNKLIATRQGELQKFVPDVASTGVISDGSLGSALNNKLRRISTDVNLEGSFEQTQSILRTLERLDQLLILKDFRADLLLDPMNTAVVSPTPILNTSFKIQAVIPLTPEEIAAAVPSPSPSTAPKK